MRRRGLPSLLLLSSVLLLAVAALALALDEPYPVHARESRADRRGKIDLAREIKHNDLESDVELDLVTDEDEDDGDEDELFKLVRHDATLGRGNYVDPPPKAGPGVQMGAQADEFRDKNAALDRLGGPPGAQAASPQQPPAAQGGEDAGAGAADAGAGAGGEGGNAGAGALVMAQEGGCEWVGGQDSCPKAKKQSSGQPQQQQQQRKCQPGEKHRALRAKRRQERVSAQKKRKQEREKRRKSHLESVRKRHEQRKQEQTQKRKQQQEQTQKKQQEKEALVPHYLDDDAGEDEDEDVVEDEDEDEDEDGDGWYSFF